jgi:hypothetical protein
LSELALLEGAGVLAGAAVLFSLEDDEESALPEESDLEESELDESDLVESDLAASALAVSPLGLLA